MSDNRTTIAHVIANGHSFEKHGDEFRDRSLGPVFPDSMTGGGNVTRAEVANFVRMTMADTDAMTFTSPAHPPKYPEPAQFIYSEKTNTLIVLDPRNVDDFGTVYRPDNGIDQFRQLAMNSPGSPSIRQGPNAINGAIERFEKEIFDRPAARATLEARAKTLGVRVDDPAARVATPAQNTNATAVADDAARQAAAAAAITEEGTRLANEIIGHDDTLGFLADKDGGTMHFFSEQHNALVSIDTEGNKIIKTGGDEIIEEFLELQQKAAAEIGDAAEIVNGGLQGLDGYFKGLNGGRVAHVLEFFGDAARLLGKTASVLGPLGMVVAGAATAAEVEGLYEQADIARSLDIIPSDTALNQYYGILGIHGTQATVDPTIAAGELVTQQAFDLWCDTYDIPQEWREKLEPESLGEMVFGDGSHGPDTNAAYNDPFFELYDALPTAISEDMPPEIQTLVQFKAIIKAEESNMRMMQGFDRNEAQQRLENAENMYTEHYDALLEGEQIGVVTAYLSEQEAPAPLEPAPSEDNGTRIAENTAPAQSIPTPM